MLIATIRPTSEHAPEVAANPAVDALRFNTIEPSPWSERETLKRIQDLCGPKELWVDLKARQLRIASWADPFYDVMELSHGIKVPLPAKIRFKDHTSTITHIIDGRKLILDHPPRLAVGRGQPVNIQDPALEIDGFLTDRDKRYAEAGQKLGIRNFMLSFTERQEDLEELWGIVPNARIGAKIESPKGLVFVTNIFPAYKDRVQLVAARDDLMINIGQNKVKMLQAERLILASDPTAIAASRVLTSLENSEEVSLGDLKDLQSLSLIGYRNLMLSDGICNDRDAFKRAMAVYAQFQEYVKDWQNLQAAGEK